MADSSRRLLLRVSVKLMMTAAVVTVLYVLFSSIQNEDEAESEQRIAPLRIQLNTSTVNPQRLVWAGGTVIIIKRDPVLLASLIQHDNLLVDPNSHSAKQPATIIGPERSLRSDFFLAYDRGNDMGCPLNWIPAGNHEAPLQPWPGGFRDNCRGSWYDAAGRVFKGQEAQRNLDIPPYRLLEGGLLEIGLSGDNAAPAN